jgi:PKHD-type hydroxylase
MQAIAATPPTLAKSSKTWSSKNKTVRLHKSTHKGKLPQFNKYTEGGAYHKHSDSAFMGSPEIRTDLSVTIFLSDPADYDGGELTLEYSSGEVRKVKERKGTLVCCTTSRP